MEFDFEDWFLKLMQKKQNILWRKQGILWIYEPHLHVQDVNYKTRNKSSEHWFLLWYYCFYNDTFFLGNFFHPKLLPTPNTSTYTILSKQILVWTLDRTNSSSVNRGHSLTWHKIMACLLVVLVTNRYPLPSFWILFSLQIFSRCPLFQRPFPIVTWPLYCRHTELRVLNGTSYSFPDCLGQSSSPSEFENQCYWMIQEIVCNPVYRDKGNKIESELNQAVPT